MTGFRWLGILLTLSASLRCQATQFPPRSPFKRQGTDNKGPLQNTKGDILLTDKQQAHIYLPLTVNGTSVVAALDTILGDLWISGTLPNPEESGLTVTLEYPSIKTMEAQITHSKVGLQGVDLGDQQYLWTSVDPDGFPFDLNGKNSTHGVLGLGPSSVSLVKSKVSSASSPFDNWVLRGAGDSSYLTILYSPSEKDRGQGSSFAGFISFGEIIDLPRYLGVTPEQLAPFNLPDLTQISKTAAVPLSASQTIIIDGIRIGRTSLNISSSVASNLTNKLVAQVQSANPSIVLEKKYVDAIYGSINGAGWSSADKTYRLPCTTEIYVTIVIQGQEYLIDPLITVAPSDASEICIGKFVASDASNSKYDIALGTAFMSSVYAMYGYQNSSGGKGRDAYWKFLSIINVNDASDLFEEYRRKNSMFVHTSAVTSSAIIFSSTSRASSSSSSLLSLTSTGSFTAVTTSVVDSSSQSTISLSSSTGAVSSLPGNGTQSVLEPTTVFITISPSSSPPPPATATITASTSTIPEKSDKTLVGNLNTDDDTDEGESIQSVLSQVKYWVPSIIVGIAVLLIVAVVAIIFLILDQRNRSRTRPSAYSALHARSAPTDVPLYGADEERLHVPYADKERTG